MNSCQRSQLSIAPKLLKGFCSSSGKSWSCRWPILSGLLIAAEQWQCFFLFHLPVFHEFCSEQKSDMRSCLPTRNKLLALGPSYLWERKEKERERNERGERREKKKRRVTSNPTHKFIFFQSMIKFTRFYSSLILSIPHCLPFTSPSHLHVIGHYPLQQLAEHSPLYPALLTCLKCI